MQCRHAVANTCAEAQVSQVKLSRAHCNGHGAPPVVGRVEKLAGRAVLSETLLVGSQVGIPNDSNFGYPLPARAKLEYIDVGNTAVL